MSAQPGLNARMLVGPVVVYDKVELQVGGGLAIDLLEESNELLVSMTGHAIAYDFSIKHTECDK